MLAARLLQVHNYLMDKPLFVVDVDLTIYDCFSKPPQLINGSRLLLQTLSTIGEVHLWSAGGESHARNIAQEFELTDTITDYHNKPAYPPTEKEAIRILGRVATLQIDDDPTERIADWPFVEATAMRELYGLY